MSQTVEIIENTTSVLIEPGTTVEVIEELINVVEISGGTSENRVSLDDDTTLTGADSNTVYDNEGALARVNVELPASEAEYVFTFIDVSGFGWDISVPSETIRIGSSITTSGGSMQSSDFGDVKLRGTSSSGYKAENFTGTWVES